MQRSYNPCKETLTPQIMTTRSIVVDTSWQSTRPRTRIIPAASMLLVRHRAASQRSNMRKVFQTAQSCSAWNSFSAANSYARDTINHQVINNRPIRHLQNQEFLFPQSLLLPHRMSQICLFLLNLTSLRSRQRRGLKLQIMPQWLQKLTLSGAKILPVQQRQKAV